MIVNIFYLLFWVLIPSISASSTGFKLLMTSDAAVDYLTFPQLDNLDTVSSKCCGRPNFITSDARTETVYWTDDSEGKPAIYKSKLSSHRQPKLFLNTGIVKPEGIAFDWLYKRIYFADSELGKIFVCSENNQTLCAIVIHEDIDNKPCGIALVPNEVIMFWTVFGKSPSIKTANMDGSSIQTVVTTDLIRPSDIVVDDGKIYWTDILKETIESTSFDGSNRQIITRSPVSSGFDIQGDMLYWFDINDYTLMKQNKTANIADKLQIPDSLKEYIPEKINGLHVMDIDREPNTIDMVSRNVKCPGGVITLSKNGGECLCSIGTIKVGDFCLDGNQTSKYVVAVNNRLSSVHIGKFGFNILDDIPLSSEIKEISAMVYNPINRTIVISENTSKKIVEYDVETNRVSVLVEHDVVDVISIDIDSISENLIWLDAGKQTIEIMSLRTRKRYVLSKNVESVDQIALFLNKLVFTKTGNMGNQEIYKISLTDITIDKPLHLLHSTTVKISRGQQNGFNTYAFVGTERVNLKAEYDDWKQNCPKPFDEKNVFNLDWVKNQIYWMGPNGEINVVVGFIGEFLSGIVKSNDYICKDNNGLMLAGVPGADYLNYITNKRLAHDCSPLYRYGAHCPHVCIPYGSRYAGTCRCTLGFHSRWYDNGSVACIPEASEINNNDLENYSHTRTDEKLDEIDSLLIYGIIE